MRSRALTLALVALVLLAGCLGTEEPETGDDDADDVPTPPGASGPGSNITWTSLPPVPTPRTEVATAILDGELVVIGGFESNNRPSVVVEALDLAEETWRSLPALPLPLHHARAVAVDGSVHVFGGYNAIPFQATTTHLVWSPGDAMWANASPLPNARGGHGAAVLDGSVYLVGGVGMDGELIATVDVYDPEADAWSTAEPLPTPRDHLGVAATEAGVHAVGGREQSFATNMPRHEILVPGDGWSRAEPMPTARGGIDAGTVAGQLVVAGGEETEGTFEEVEAWDPATGNWTVWPPLPTPRHGLGVDGHQGDLITTAGGPEPGLTVSDAVEVLGPEDGAAGGG